jgi:ribosomal protein S18 acetylase RimI-like enzyme
MIKDIISIQKQVYSEALQENQAVIESILDYNISHILKVDHIPIGYILLHPWSNLKNPPQLNTVIPQGIDSSCLFIHDLCILEEYRNKGFAKMLLTNIKDVSHVSLVSVNNSTRFWEKQGFQIAKTQPETSIKSYQDPTACLMYTAAPPCA